MIIFKNATFISCGIKNEIFHEMAVEKGRIVATGDNLRQQGMVVDLAGATVVPAFVDTHMHFQSYALFHDTVDVRDVKDFHELRALIEEYITKNPQAKIIPAFGCSAHIVREKRLPERADLDAITGLPLLIVKYDGHAAVANTALLKMMSDKVTADPGCDWATGWLYQNAFYYGVNECTAQIPPLKLLRSMSSAANELAKAGIGLVHAAEGVGYKNDMDITTINMIRYGLPQAYRVFFQTMSVEKVLKRKMPRIGGCFSLALDGCFGSEDAALNEPYSHDDRKRGVLFYEQDAVNRFLDEANRAGLQIAVHAIGDRAVDQALTGFEYALAAHPRHDHRHIIIHADLIPPAYQMRAARLGIAIALQPPFLDWPQEPPSYLTEILGDRAAELLPIKSLGQRGILLAAGSDAPCTLPAPLNSIHQVVNHPNPAERVDVLEALRLHTLYGAMLSFDEEKRGSLEAGKIADFITLSADPLSVPPAKLRDISVTATYLAGQKYREKGYGAVGLLRHSLYRRWFRREFC